MTFIGWIEIDSGVAFCVYKEDLSIIVEKHSYGNKVDGGRKSYSPVEFSEFLKSIPINSEEITPQIIELTTL